MEMARGGASCREIAEALGIGSPDVVRYWLKGGGTKEARMGGRARTPEGDEPAYAGFEGGLEERIRRLELENDILRGVSVNVFFTIFTNAFSPIAPTRIRRIRQRGCAAFGV